MPNETEGRIPLADLLVFHQLTRSLTSSFDLDTILRTILEQMERMVEAEFWALLMLDESSHDLYYAIAAGFASSPARALPDGSSSTVKHCSCRKWKAIRAPHNPPLPASAA
jgi:GAF domain-containing protein